MNIEINDDEKNKKIEELIKYELKIIEKIKEKLKKEINEIVFIMTESEIDNMYNLVQEDVEDYFSKYKERIKLVKGTEFVIEDWRKNKFFVNTLKIIFNELEIIVKARNKTIFDGESILFKRNEGVLISFLIENFRNINGIENDFEIYITKKELKKFIEIYEVEINFIDRLEKNELLIIDKYNNDNLFILLKNSPYTYENEINLRKVIIQNYNLKINKKINGKIREEIKNEIEKYNIEIQKNEEKIRCINNTANNLKQKIKKLETGINNLKTEIITILGIFIGLFSYLSANFSFIKELLSNSKAIENIFLIIAVFCVGLIPVIIIFLLIKYLFLTPNDNSSIESKKLTVWKIFFPPTIIIIISIILVVAIIAIYMIFWNNYKEYNLKINKLEHEVEVKTEEIQKLANEIEKLKTEIDSKNERKDIKKAEDNGKKINMFFQY